MNTQYGRSDTIRTCDILLPKQARYQLRYTPKYFVVRNFCGHFPKQAATGYRSETLSHCSLGALRIALYFFLLSHCLLPPPAAATPEPLHPVGVSLHITKSTSSKKKCFFSGRSKDDISKPAQAVSISWKETRFAPFR